MSHHDVRFGFEGATSAEGPFGQLQVRHVRGTETIGRGFRYEIDAFLADDAPGTNVDDLVDRWGSLWIQTHVGAGWRVVHGVIGDAAFTGRNAFGRLFRIVLYPPTIRAVDLTKYVVHVDRTLEEILLVTLTRKDGGMALSPSNLEEPTLSVAVPDFTRYVAPRATFALRLRETERVHDRSAYPLCVQYEEDDVAFLSRLCETEGIGYHFEHAADEITLVLADADEGRVLRPDVVVAPNALHQVLMSYERGRHVRPAGVQLRDYDFRRPDYELAASSGHEDASRTSYETGGFEQAKDEGALLALRRAQRFQCEATTVRIATNCCALSSGQRIFVDHGDGEQPAEHVVVSASLDIARRLSFEGAHPPEHTRIVAELVQPKAGAATQIRTTFRPARITPRPRVRGTQTAIVVAEPGADTEINVGGSCDLGSVRVRFVWDAGIDRRRGEPTSCWIRVSQVFAGPSHGAMFHPRVGDEVIVDFLDGDPDRPIIVGRVHNGKNLPPENATQRPTFSCLKSLTSPRDGNYNMLAFEDAQGSEELILHAARNLVIHAKNDAFRSAGSNDGVHIVGDQTIEIEGKRTTTIGGEDKTSSDTKISFHAPEVFAEGTGFLTLEGGLTVVIGKAQLILKGAMVSVEGGAISIKSEGVLNLTSGGPTNVHAGADVNVTGTNINLNCG